MKNCKVSIKGSKAKEPVKLRAKRLAHGNLSLYLDTYQNGKRWYEFLRLYIVPERTAADRRANRATMKQAEGIRVRRMAELRRAPDRPTAAPPRASLTLMEWMARFAEKKRQTGQSDSYSTLITKAIRHLKLYRGERVAIKDVDKEYCLGFIDYLGQTPMSRITAAAYFRCLNCALNAAVRADVIKSNPIAKIPAEDRIKIPESDREYLTRDEIVRLVHKPCSHAHVKMAYMFGCMCALRLSDIRALRWGDIQRDGHQWRASILMVKTQRKLWLPLSDEAVRWLPERGAATDGDFIFSLPSVSRLNWLLKEWVKSAGIGKRITFHTSRHTNATLLLSLGVDIYTVSKLLGHSQIRTTQIYARIVDKKKDDAVNLIPSFSSSEPPGEGQ